MYPTRIIFQYTKALSKCGGIKVFISPNMADLVTYLYRHSKEVKYYGSDIHDLYHYLYMIGCPTTLTCSGWCYQSIDIKTNIDLGSMHPVISSLRGKQQIFCKCCGLSGHKADHCITRGENFCPPSICKKKNKFNEIHGDTPHEPPKYFPRTPPALNFKSTTSTISHSPDNRYSPFVYSLKIIK